MADYTVTVEGKDYDVTAPDERTAWAWANQYHQQATPSTPSQDKQQTPAPKTTLGGLTTEVARGILRGPSDVANMVGRAGSQMLLGPFAGKMVAGGMERLSGPSREIVKAQPSTPAERFAGTLAEITAGSAVGGGLNNVLNAGMTALSALGGAVGEQIGGEKGKVIGSLAPAVPSAITALANPVLRIGRNIIDPMLAGGTKRAAVRTAAEAAGPDREAIAALLQKQQEFVPGSRPTAGEAAAPIGRAEFSGLQDIVKGRNPTPFVRNADAQAAAREAALGWAGDQAAVQAAKDVRNAATSPMREAAIKGATTVNGEKIAGQIDTILAQPGLRASDVVTKSLGDIKDKIRTLVNERGIISADDIYTIRKEAGNTIRKYAEESKNWDQRLTAGLEKDVQRFIDDAIESAGGTGWRDYLATYAKHSRGIDQMKIGEALREKLVTPLSEAAGPTKQRSALYAQALRDQMGTTERATGRANMFSDILEPNQIASAKAVEQDIARSARHETLARAGSEKARELVGQISPKVPAAGMFSPHYSVLRAISNRLAGRIEGKSLDELSRLMQSGNTQELGNALAKLPIQQRTLFVKTISDAIKASKYAAVRGAAVTMQE